MVGDWLKGTRGMKAEARGVYLGLLLHQFETGWIPSGLEELALIEPEVGKVWVSLKEKFVEFEPGKLRNNKLVEVLAFWEKQRGNGSKGGRPKKENPKPNPNNNPEQNPKPNHHNDLDHDNDHVFEKEGGAGETDSDARVAGAIGEILLDNLKVVYGRLNVPEELDRFKAKVRGSPNFYRNHDDDGLRMAFQSQLRSMDSLIKNSSNGKSRTNTPIAGTEIIPDRKDFGTKQGF